ncbi:MAG: hypothetical protein H6686_03310 [Fibrobacteria bacterium]|nr:hypothetical protein [Fibrobacteria bacterium]
MITRLLSAILVTGLFAAASAQEGGKANALYFHPVITALTASLPGVPLVLPVTIEHELPDAKSFTLQPALMTGTVEPSDVEVFGFSLTAAYRTYLNGVESKGVYFAPAGQYQFLSLKDGKLSGSVSLVSGLVYFGARGKWDEDITLYADAGLGYGVGFGKAEDIDFTVGGVAFDVNLGIGVPF